MKHSWKRISLLLTALVLTGCGAAAPTPEAETPPVQEETPAPDVQAPAAAAWLPAGTAQVLSETAPLPELAQAIAEYYEIPREEWAGTRYYYNYVDLNGDGTEEIFAVAVGPYTSGTGGDSGLWLLPYAGMSVSQTFTLVRMPILVSDAMTDGAHDLIFERSGGGASAELVRLTCTDGVYTNPADAEVLTDLGDIQGTAILANDLAADMDSGSYLTLADAESAQ